LFLEHAGTSRITSGLALQWATQPQHIQQAEWAARLSVVRGFARHWSATDPVTEVPPKGLLPYRPRRAKPYIYSDEEIHQLLEAAKNMPTTHSLQPWTYHCLFGLLAVTGLRISEALNLRSTDVDWSEGILTIRNSKFGKSRLIPLQASSLKILSDYGARRDLLFAKRKTPYFFCSRYDGRLDEGQVRRVFYMISRQIGIRGAWPATDRVCTTFVIVSQSKRCCAGIAPGKMSGGVYPSYPPISVTDMSPTPTGT
jgi:integrase